MKLALTLALILASPVVWLQFFLAPIIHLNSVLV